MKIKKWKWKYGEKVGYGRNDVNSTINDGISPNKMEKKKKKMKEKRKLKIRKYIIILLLLLLFFQ